MGRKYLICFIVFIFFLFYTANVRAPCCEGVCHIGGRCCCLGGGTCDVEDKVWYIGCDFDGGIACPDEVLDNCLVCECSSTDSCEWVDYGLVLCSQEPQCQVCSYDDIDFPSSSSCSPTSDCIIDEVCYIATQYVGENCCYGPDQIDSSYADCLGSGDVVGTLCYYGPQTNDCTTNGWECSDGAFFDCSSLDDFDPSDKTLANSVPTAGTCTSLCSDDECCETTTVICDNDPTDNFYVTASACGERFTVRGVEYYCHNDGGEFYIDTDPEHPDETCDDGYNNNCDVLVDGEESWCEGSCLLASASWSSDCAFDGDQVSLVVNAENDLCDGKDLQVEIWEDDDGGKDPTFDITQLSTITFSGTETNTLWAVEREADPDDEAEEDMEYKFTASIGGASMITESPLIVKFCSADDSDCDGESDGTDECPDTLSCSIMDEEAPGCSVDQAETYAKTYEVPGLGVNFFSFFLVVFVLSALLVYNFERNL